MKCLLIFLVLWLTVLPGLAQISTEVWTDKATYEYGEPVEINLKLTNTGQELIILTTHCNGPTYKLDDVRLDYAACVAYTHPFWFSPGSWRTWTWTLSPNEIALPKSGGEHNIIVYFADMADSTVFTAPRFLGGRAYLGFHSTTPPDTVSALISRLHATVLDENERLDGSTTLFIEMAGLDIYEAIEEYSGHPNVRYFELDQYIQNVTSVRAERHEIPTTFEVSVPFPNPFSEVTTLSISTPRPMNVVVELYDLLGRRVRSVFNGFLPANSDKKIIIRSNGQAEGIYYVVISGPQIREVRPIVLMRD